MDEPLETVKANRCPYCGAAYLIAAGGCVLRCAGWLRHAALVREAIEADLRETDEP